MPICSSIFEVYEAATLPAETLPPKARNTGRNARIFFECWSKSEYPYSAKIASNFANCSVDFRYILGGYPLKFAGRHPRRLRDDFVTIFDGFGLPFGVLGGALWGYFGRMFCEMDLFYIFYSYFVGL